MTTTTTWRDFADRLTPEQIELLGRATHADEVDLLNLARDFATQNAVHDAHRHVLPPHDAMTTYPWFDAGEGRVSRFWTGSAWELTSGTWVRIGGEQSTDGTTSRHVEIRPPRHSDGEMTAAQARETARALIAAADEIDRMSA